MSTSSTDPDGEARDSGTDFATLKARSARKFRRVIGAGVAGVGAAVAAGAPYDAATTLANYASGLVVRRVGNYAPSPDELAWALETWGESGCV